MIDIEGALTLYSDIGADYLSFKPFSEHPQMRNKSGFTYSAELIDVIDKTVLAFASTSTAGTVVIYRKRSAEAYHTGMQRFSSCCALPFWGYLSSRGDFYTCSVFLDDERFKVGNIYDESMKTIFLGERRKRSIAFAEHELEICHECRVNCRMARINEFLSFLNSIPDHVNFI